MGGVEKEGAQRQDDAAPQFGQWRVSTGMGLQLEQVLNVQRCSGLWGFHLHPFVQLPNSQ